MSDKRTELIKEQRTNEAVKKNLMGIEGKIGCVLKHMGEPIIQQGIDDGIIERTYLDDPYLDEEEEMPIAYEEEIEQPEGWEWSEPRELNIIRPRIVGWVFDALRFGMHLEINYKESDAKLSMFYKGDMVFQEQGGELLCYTPAEEWESKIDQLYKVASKKKAEKKKEKQEQIKKEAAKNKKTWLDYAKKMWGFDWN